MEYVYLSNWDAATIGGFPIEHSLYDDFYDSIKEELGANNGEVNCPYHIYFGENNNPDPYAPNKISESSYSIICYGNEISLGVIDSEYAIKCSKDLDTTVQLYLTNLNSSVSRSYLIFLHGGDFWEAHEIDYFHVVRYL